MLGRYSVGDNVNVNLFCHFGGEEALHCAVRVFKQNQSLTLSNSKEITGLWWDLEVQGEITNSETCRRRSRDSRIFSRVRALSLWVNIHAVMERWNCKFYEDNSSSSDFRNRVLEKSRKV